MTFIPRLRPFFAPAFAIGLMLSVALPAAANDKLTVLLEWFVNPDHMPLVVGIEGGFFAKEGLDVTLVPPSDASQPPRLIAAGQAEIAVGYQPNLMMDIAAGLPLTRFATMIETPLNCLLVKDDGPIKSIADLKGKKIGFSVSGFEDGLLNQMLGTANLSTKDVELINVNFALSTSLLANQVDAVIGAYRNFEVTQMAIAGGKGRCLPVEEYGVPPYDELVLMTNTALKNDPRLPRFVKALEAATQYLTNHPKEAWALFVKAHPDLDDQLNKTAFDLTLPTFAKRPAAMDNGRYERFAMFLKERGLLPTAEKAEAYSIVVR